jgi:hypothetical protein
MIRTQMTQIELIGTDYILARKKGETFIFATIFI